MQANRDFDVVFNRINKSDKRRLFSRVLSLLIWGHQVNKDSKNSRSASVTHTGIKVCIEGDWFVSEMQSKGARCTRWNDYKKKYTGEVWRISVPDVMDKQELKQHIVEVSGVLPYDFFGIIIVQPLKSFVKRMNPEWGTWFDHEFIKRKGKKCSVWVNYILKTAKGIDYKHNVNPSELYKSITSLPPVMVKKVEDF